MGRWLSTAALWSRPGMCGRGWVAPPVFAAGGGGGGLSTPGQRHFRLGCRREPARILSSVETLGR